MSLRDIQQRDQQLDTIYDGIQKTLTNIKNGKSADPKDVRNPLFSALVISGALVIPDDLILCQCRLSYLII